LGIISAKKICLTKDYTFFMGSLHSMTDEPGIINTWPPHPNAGQLGRLIPSSELPVGSAEASFEIASPWNFCLCASCPFPGVNPQNTP